MFGHLEELANCVESFAGWHDAALLDLGVGREAQVDHEHYKLEGVSDVLSDSAAVDAVVGVGHY